MENSKKKLLVIEEDPGLRSQLRWSLDKYDVVVAADRQAAVAALRRHEPAVVTLDLGLPPDADGTSEGFATLREILSLSPDTKVIVLTGNSEHSCALQAVDKGAYDFHLKSGDPQVLSLVIERAFRLHELQCENRSLRAAGAQAPLAGIITRDPLMLKLCRQVEKVANASATVMLLGPSGTGKEILARAVHHASQRKDKRFVAINCAAIPEALLESELFGYEKGAFTGAAKQTPGKIEMANGGTFFLDEVGDLPIQLQAKLLRFLQERVIERLGGRDELPVDVRVVCATHQDLPSLVAQGRFREDLHYRLSAIVLKIPPLHERVGDAVLLAQHFRNHFAAEQRRPRLPFSPDALAAIEAYSWPGNVREVENCIKRAIILADGPLITGDDLGLPVPTADRQQVSLRKAREEAEYKILVTSLAHADGSVSKTAELLGVSRPTVYELMDRHGLREVQQS